MHDVHTALAASHKFLSILLRLEDIDREPRTVIHVKRANMFDHMG